MFNNLLFFNFTNKSAISLSFGVVNFAFFGLNYIRLLGRSGVFQTVVSLVLDATGCTLVVPLRILHLNQTLGWRSTFLHPSVWRLFFFICKRESFLMSSSTLFMSGHWCTGFLVIPHILQRCTAFIFKHSACIYNYHISFFHICLRHTLRVMFWFVC